MSERQKQKVDSRREVLPFDARVVRRAALDERRKHRPRVRLGQAGLEPLGLRRESLQLPEDHLLTSCAGSKKLRQGARESLEFSQRGPFSSSERWIRATLTFGRDRLKQELRGRTRVELVQEAVDSGLSEASEELAECNEFCAKEGPSVRQTVLPFHDVERGWTYP